MAPVLEIENLHTQIRLRQGTVRAVDGVSLFVDAGETLGIVGESGCGKTMTALSVMGLLPVGGVLAEGVINLDGRRISGLSDEQMRRVRGNEVGMIFQDPLDVAEPDDDGRQADRRGGAAAPRGVQAAGDGPGGRGA